MKNIKDNVYRAELIQFLFFVLFMLFMVKENPEPWEPVHLRCWYYPLWIRCLPVTGFRYPGV